MDTEKIKCAIVKNLPSYPIPLGSRKSNSHGSKCRTNQDLSKPFPICYTVNANDTRIDSKNHSQDSLDGLYCSQFSTSKEGNTFQCIGNRAYAKNQEQLTEWVEDQHDNYTSYLDAYNTTEPPHNISYIKNEDINSIRDTIDGETQERLGHIFYSIDGNLSEVADENLLNVTDQDVIIHNQQTRLLSVLTDIKSIIYSKEDFRVKRAYYKDARNAHTQDMVETDNLRKIEDDLYYTGCDCICYSDCTQFKLGAGYYCTCNVNCKCNYG